MSELQIERLDAPILIVGTGSAGYCAADRLLMAGVPADDILMIADKIRAGASRNAGSDKQTYYKLSLAGDAPDSVADLAATLFSGGAMDGDNALVEAAYSTRCFLHLVDAGVPFPRDQFGQFVGYKTDHDPRERATSIGPYTSRRMTQELERRVEKAGVRRRDGCRVIDLIVDRSSTQPRVVGVLTLDKSAATARPLEIRSGNVIYATGGPAGMYADSVFPHGQWGATGAALRAGAPGKNLTEWQFGLSSTNPRWNVSGSYMQVIPRFISTAADGSDEREFLIDEIADYGTLNSLVFLKGYQWPFDVRKAARGSSVIDLLVYRETVLRGRRVFLDYRVNPGERPFDADALWDEAREYLRRTGVLDVDPDAPPVARLKVLNHKAYDFYLERNPGIDLATDLLEVAVCAQHNNGGLEVDAWWRSPLSGLYPIGEAAGAHGVYRPGGAALNSGQVGATRVAEWLAAQSPNAQFSAAKSIELPDEATFADAAQPLTLAALQLMQDAGQRFRDGVPDSTADLLTEIAQTMSQHAGLVRSRESIAAALASTERRLAKLPTESSADPDSRRSIDRLFLIRDILTAQQIYLTAMADYLGHGGRSRGSVLYQDPAGELPQFLPEETFRFSPDTDGSLDDQAQIVTVNHAADDAPGEITCQWRPVRPLPSDDIPFEVLWRQQND